ncbi:YbaB/EbfC family nucleoid-associated protein [Rhodococcus sp. D2-41]|uniref:YbaB/EbfC family nucleoid-associated protein n=1 Tax=Speluncibacter jeojiensis TaxID=2710754 RepID=A0A9X4M2A0_9ACTN|nr:YbaB/EbfC family nucleoid-associated protein [Rhodococcus sp. D2-41]MDG3009013.1 YbaB/EbfC family nucleoid-associated protein [Rhodococcus sp. D2-41]MDG3015524.1 YbaB/EbfC family nucleoid-associated protein [Corynebacteriales bacterium D3-21]
MSYLDDWNAEQRDIAAQWRQRHRSLQLALDGIRVRGSSPNGELGVVVDARGAVTDIRLSPQALRLGDDRWGRLMLQTIQRAQADAARQAEVAAKPFTDDPAFRESIAVLRDLVE